MDLEQIRQDIDQVDAELVQLLERRMELVTQVTAFKRATGKPVLDTSREQAVLGRVAARVSQPDFIPTIRATFADIMAHSRAYQTEKLKD